MRPRVYTRYHNRRVGRLVKLLMYEKVLLISNLIRIKVKFSYCINLRLDVRRSNIRCFFLTQRIS